MYWTPASTFFRYHNSASLDELKDTWTPASLRRPGLLHQSFTGILGVLDSWGVYFQPFTWDDRTLKTQSLTYTSGSSVETTKQKLVTPPASSGDLCFLISIRTLHGQVPVGCDSQEYTRDTDCRGESD